MRPGEDGPCTQQRRHVPGVDPVVVGRCADPERLQLGDGLVDHLLLRMERHGRGECEGEREMGRGCLGVDRAGAVAPGVLDRPQRRPAGPQGQLDAPRVARPVAEACQPHVDGGAADQARLQMVGGDAVERRVGPPPGVRQHGRVARLQAEEGPVRQPGQQTGPDQVVRRKPFGQAYGVRMRRPGRLEVAGRGLLRVGRRDRHRIVRLALGLGGEIVVDVVRQPVVLEAQRQCALGQPQVQHPAGAPRILPLPHVEGVLQDGHRRHRAVPAALVPRGAQQPGRRGQPALRVLTGVGRMPFDGRCPRRLAAHQHPVHGCSYL